MKFLKFLSRVIFVVFIIIFCYFAISSILLYFPTQNSCKNRDKSIFLYSTNTGLLSHTELIIQTSYFKEDDLKLFDGLLRKKRSGYLAFSYGDEAFLMDKKGFDDLNLTLASRGLFLNTPALIRVGYYRGFYKDKTIEINIDNKCLKDLENSILNEFSKRNAKLIRYNDVYKDRSFYFYEANKSYNLFHTCNTWMGDRLRDAGVGMSYWTPFAWNILDSIDKDYH